ncbi:MAG TPA: ATP-binding protein [Candidatus Acidoferrales bacterium]|nr:ATP-binding protein [Candidatus Acidoferrales bacterium]
MSPIKSITANDIGGELLPIITRGLYKDPLDALREYIQNSIDAGSSEVHVTLSRDLIMIRDDGTGMNESTARNSVRLGISEKKHTHDIGFRGIGIYSSFELCSELEIYTKVIESSEGYLVRFNFDGMRTRLEQDEKRKKLGHKKKFYLEKLLKETVVTKVDEEHVITTHGTVVILNGIRPEFQKRIIDTAEVIEYLQNVIPLPFSERFSYSTIIDEKLRRNDYRSIKLKLTSPDHDDYIYKPYEDSIFEHGKGEKPKFFEVKRRNSVKKFGFCWVCHNDDRKALKQDEMRGILIKKFGFSIAGREYLETYFTRVVFNRRITGELIVQNRNLIPNAARSDFEHNEARAEFILALTDLVQEMTSWAENIQQRLKARELLADMAPVVSEINDKLLESSRDISALLSFNVQLRDFKKQLSTHQKMMHRYDGKLYAKTTKLVHKAEKTIHDLLTIKNRSTKGSNDLLVDILKSTKLKADENELEYANEEPKSLIELFDQKELLTSAPLRDAIVYIDQLLHHLLSKKRYQIELRNLIDTLEEE